MKTEELESEYPPASEIDILAAESDFGVKFPQAYKDFVQKINGTFIGGYLPVTGYPNNLDYYLSEGLVSVGYIYGIYKENESHSIYCTTSHLKIKVRVPGKAQSGQKAEHTLSM